MVTPPTPPPDVSGLNIFSYWFMLSVQQRASTTAWLAGCWWFVAGDHDDAQTLYSATLMHCHHSTTRVELDQSKHHVNHEQHRPHAYDLVRQYQAQQPLQQCGFNEPIRIR